MTALEPIHDEPADCFFGVEPVVWWERRARLFGAEVSRLHRVVDDAVAVLHGLGAHEEADRISARSDAF